MIRITVFLVVVTICFGFVSETFFLKNEKTISTGEKLEYRMYLGFFTVGKGVTEVDKNFYMRNNMICYKVDAYMETLGMVSWVSKVKDNWGAYLDTAKLVVQESYRNIKEGNYRLNESIKYDHLKKVAAVRVVNNETGIYGEPKVYSLPDDVRDIVSGFMYLRIINFNLYKEKDIISISGFFEDQSYDFKIQYMGKEVISTSLGKIRCHKLVPIMPHNQLFAGKNSVTTWISADKNQIPIRVDTKMFIGHAGTELVNFRGLKNQFKIIR